MSENTTANATTTTQNESGEASKPSAEELQKMFESLAPDFQDALNNLNKVIDEHNAKVSKVKTAQQSDTKKILAEIREQNPSNNSKVAAINKKVTALNEQIEKLIAEANKVIVDEGLMPEELTEEQVTKLKSDIAEGNKAIKDQSNALVQMENMLPFLKGKLSIHIKHADTLRGPGAKATSGGEGPKRPRFKRIEINNVVEDEKGNKVYGLVDGEQKWTFSFASAYLRKQHKGIKWTQKELADAYFGDKSSQDELPEVHTFVMPYTYKDGNGNEHTVNYEIKATR